MSFYSSNYSLYAVPAYYIISMIPHVYATSLIKKYATYNNAAPRSSAFQEKLKEKCLASDYARIDRAKAAHNNSLENFPLDSIALVSGTFAGISAGSMNTAAALLIALRIAYIFLYINTETLPKSFARSFVWITSRVVALTVLFKVAHKVVDEGL